MRKLPPLQDNPEFAANIVSALRRGHLMRIGIIAGATVLGLAGMLALVPIDMISDVFSLLGNWSEGLNISAPEMTKENAFGAAIVVVLFVMSLLATQDV